MVNETDIYLFLSTGKKFMRANNHELGLLDVIREVCDYAADVLADGGESENNRDGYQRRCYRVFGHFQSGLIL
jgi:hypothetical protein